MNWLINNGGSIIALIVVLLIVALALRSVLKNKNDCGCGCSGCNGACHQHSVSKR